MSPLIASLPGTKPVFWDDTYLFEGTAKCVAARSEVNPKDQSTVQTVVLDATLFHPQGGGQPTDIGEIRATDDTDRIFRVTMVRQKPDGEIVHHGEYSPKEAAPFAAGDIVRLVVDGKNRLLCCTVPHSWAPAGHGYDAYRPAHERAEGLPLSKGGLRGVRGQS